MSDGRQILSNSGHAPDAQHQRRLSLRHLGVESPAIVSTPKRLQLQTHAFLQQVDKEPKETAAGASYPHAHRQTNISVQ